MTIQQQEKIDRYVWNKMPAEERAAFEAAMKKDVDLNREVLAQQEAMKIVDGMGDEIISARIRKAGLKTHSGQEAAKSTTGLWLLVLALLAALGVGLFFYMQKEEVVDAPKIIYASNFEAYPLSFGDRGKEDLLTEASIAYAQKEYSEALDLFAQAQVDNEDAKVALAKGISLMALKRYDEAIGELTPVVADPLYGAQSRWYLALAYLQTEQIPEVKNQLEMLLRSGENFKQDAAKEILEKIN